MEHPITDPHTKLQIDLQDALEAFDAAMSILKERLRAEFNYPAWAFHCLSSKDARQAIIGIIGQVDYVDGQKDNESISLSGLIAVSKETYQAAATLNAAKRQLQKAFQAMDNKSVRVQEEYSDAKVTTTLVRHTLRKIGRARFHRIQACRQLVIFDKPPKKLGFFWAHTRKVERLSITEAKEKLRAKGEGVNVDRDLELLKGLPRDEQVAYVLKSPIHERANIAILHKGAKSGYKNMVKACPLPILYVAEPGDPLVDHTPLPLEKEPDEKRKPRSDKKIEDEPYLKSVPIYRYLREYRKAS